MGVVVPQRGGVPWGGVRSRDTHSVLRLPQPGGVSGVIIRTVVGLLFLKMGKYRQRKGINVTY